MVSLSPRAPTHSSILTTPRLDTQDGSKVDTVKISRGIFGALVGVDRLLDFCAKHNIKASWFVPAHTLESYPRQIAKIRDSGHEMYVRIALP